MNNAKKILVTGAKGMLAQDLCPILEDSGYDVIETTKEKLDVTDEDAVLGAISKIKPDIVIHCAGYTNVDKAEDIQEQDKVKILNADSAKYIAKACNINNSIMLYISTDYVFDGKSKLPYKPTDKTNPINFYGKTKEMGEKYVQDFCKKHYIVRTSWLYGHHGKNFVETMISLADKPQINVVDDQIGCPTWTVDLSNFIVNLIDEQPEFGIYHACGKGETSWYGFAKEIFNTLGLTVNMHPCKTEEIQRPAQRPKYSVLENQYNMKDWEKALKEYIELRIEE